MLKKYKSSAKGITLIALVITIIVLLILAGVSIATLTGDNGILTQAKEAKEKTEEAKRKEEQQLEDLLNKITSEVPSEEGYNVSKNVNSPKYLCYSQYGNVPKINGAGSLAQNDYWYDMYTGQGPKGTNDEGWYNRTDDTHNYNTSNGVLASTTGNVTGIYDMSGGSWERVAGYLDNGNWNLNTYGQSTDGSIKYFENGNLNSNYESLWNKYEVSEEEKTNKISLGDGTTLTQSELWDWNKREEKHHEARKRITEETYNNMAKHKGIGVNEVSTAFSFYAPYAPGTENNLQTWGWFKTVQEAERGTQNIAKTWDNDRILIGHGGGPLVVRGGFCANGSGAGVFYSDITGGYPADIYGFRSVLVV